MTELDENIKKFLITLSAKILKCEESHIQWEDDIDEFGYGSMEVNQLCADLNEIFSITINPSVFLEVTSLVDLSQFLKKHFYSNVESRLL